MKEISKVREFTGDNSHVSINQLIGKKISEKQKILQYLKSFEADCAAGMLLVDEVTGKETSDSVMGYEDGVYFWDTREIYHFEKYDMELQNDFIQYIMKM